MPDAVSVHAAVELGARIEENLANSLELFRVRTLELRQRLFVVEARSSYSRTRVTYCRPSVLQRIKEGQVGTEIIHRQHRVAPEPHADVPSPVFEHQVANRQIIAEGHRLANWLLGNK